MIRDVGSGLVAEAGDGEAFLAAADTLRNDPALRRAAGQRARAHAERAFSIGAIRTRFEPALGIGRPTRSHVHRHAPVQPTGAQL